MPQGVDSRTAVGRWPTNVLLDGDMADALDEQSGIRPAGSFPGSSAKGPKFTGTTYNGGKQYDGWGMTHTGAEYADEGGASRFFPVFRYQAKAPAKERPKVDGTAHPTVKPLELMRWLVRLTTPPDGIVLDPFAGSGTTVEAAMLEGFNVVGIEAESSYMPLIQARIDRAKV